MINPADIDLDKLPWLPLEEQSSPLRKPAIYFAIAANNEVLYIGRAKNAKDRWVSHHRYEELAAVGGVKVAYLLIAEHNLFDTERAFINHYNPPHNVEGTSHHGEIARLRRENAALKKEIEGLKAEHEEEIEREKRENKANTERGGGYKLRLTALNAWATMQCINLSQLNKLSADYSLPYRVNMMLDLLAVKDIDAKLPVFYFIDSQGQYLFFTVCEAGWDEPTLFTYAEAQEIVIAAIEELEAAA